MVASKLILIVVAILSNGGAGVSVTDVHTYIHKADCEAAAAGLRDRVVLGEFRYPGYQLDARCVPVTR